DGGKARIIDESCVRCGLCVPACPHDAITASGDLAKAREISRGGRGVLILGVEAAVHFYPVTPEQVVNACYRAGFRSVHRGVLGDELVAAQYTALLNQSSEGTLIRSTCPVVVEKIRREYPELVQYLAPIKTPLAAEAAYLRGMYGEDAPLVYAGVCLTEGDQVVDAVVTYEELAALLHERGIDPAGEAQHFERIPEERRRHIGTSGGMPLPVLQQQTQSSGRFRKVRGLEQLPAIARAAGTDGMDLGFVDILPCEGCLDHPLLGPREELYWRRKVVAQTEPPRSQLPVIDESVEVDIRASFTAHQNGHHAAESDVTAVLHKIGTAPGGKAWDCGACGFGTCRQFAEALLKGRADFRLCPPHQEKRALEAQREAAVDELTGLATFRVLKDRLKQEIARSRRGEEPFGVVFADLDRFKRLNDSYGHEAGNKVLAALGHKLTELVRETDVAARYGGDEFVVLLVRTDETGAQRVGEVVREGVEKLGLALGYPNGMVTVSVGVAAFDPKGEGGEDVVDRADRMLYAVKGRGGNAVS
ncbi:MAG TPA: diguanylate cyclase, partial [Gemmatimonadales bacterium]